MFEKTKVPVLGLVENMSFYCCPNCGHRADIFGHGGAKAEAARLGTEFLGEIPLLLDIRRGVGRRHADRGLGARQRCGEGLRRAGRAGVGKGVRRGGGAQQRSADRDSIKDFD